MIDFSKHIKRHKHANLTPFEAFRLLYGKLPEKQRAAIKKMNRKFSLQIVDEDTGETHNQKDIENELNKIDMRKKAPVKKVAAKKQQPKKEIRRSSKRSNRQQPKPKAKKDADIIYLDGVRVFHPHSNAPEFVIAELVISPRTFINFLKANPDLLIEHEDYGAQIKATLKESTGGKLYMEVNTYHLQVDDAPETELEEESEEEEDDDLPF